MCVLINSTITVPLRAVTEKDKIMIKEDKDIIERDIEAICADILEVIENYDTRVIIAGLSVTIFTALEGIEDKGLRMSLFDGVLLSAKTFAERNGEDK